ncbi:MAG TPA: DUF72 domain-containing protein [Kofleriaceae bacterium]|nr:DUF72 domain-containing protein [Kofleriaceae bacterium]
MAVRGYYLGCPGWGLKSWVGRLFPAGTRHTDFLARYAEVFNTVEGNTTFYALPTPDTVARWREQVPAGFRFCFKFPRTITHDRLLRGCAAEVATFLDRISPLGERLGTLFLQLPPRFGAGQLALLRDFLATLPAGFRYAVELRDAAFFQAGPEEDEAMELLRARGVDLVLMDTRGIHTSKSLTFADVRARKPNLPVVMRATAAQPLVRFVPHETFDESRPFAEPWSRQIAAWIAEGKRPYFFMHAPDDTFAPENAYAFHAMLRAHADVGELPPWPGAPRQLGLF